MSSLVARRSHVDSHNEWTRAGRDARPVKRERAHGATSALAGRQARLLARRYARTLAAGRELTSRRHNK